MKAFCPGPQTLPFPAEKFAVSRRKIRRLALFGAFLIKLGTIPYNGGVNVAGLCCRLLMHVAGAWCKCVLPQVYAAGSAVLQVYAAGLCCQVADVCCRRMVQVYAAGYVASVRCRCMLQVYAADVCCSNCCDVSVIIWSLLQSSLQSRLRVRNDCCDISVVMMSLLQSLLQSCLQVAVTVAIS